jgi:pyruvate/2-oxoglutarate dehydrogenase complex dihydrolipoamide dehydrogenase (E3) component
MRRARFAEMAEAYDLVIIGAGAAGLIAADFALRLGARVALLERDRIGGDCTWTGCVPSKSLIKAATVAASARGSTQFGVRSGDPTTDLAEVRKYLRARIEHIYAPTAPEALREKGLVVKLGAARFIDPHTLEVTGEHVQARRILLCTGAVPVIPSLAGLDQVPYLTYKEIFGLDRLPGSLIVIGGGPLGCEMAQSYQRLGTRVTLLATRLLSRAEPEISELLSRVLVQDGLEHVRARAQAVRREGDLIRVRTAEREFAAECLFIAVGRRPDMAGLGLERAGVRVDPHGIHVDERLRTTARHIYAAGDVLGGAQFSHLAGWQAFQAVRNALLPGGGAALPRAVPEVTFTVPEVAHIGLTEAAARERFGDDMRVASMDLRRIDRAVTENDRDGLIKLIAHRNGRILGASMMAGRAGEALAEVSLAIASRLRLRDLASAIHPYPTYNSAIQLLATQMATDEALTGFKGKLARALVRWSLKSSSSSRAEARWTHP